MAPKTTTTKTVAKKAKTDPPSEEEVEDKKYAVRAKAGLLTYNNPLHSVHLDEVYGTYYPNIKDEEERLKKHHEELKAKFKHPVKLSSCFEKESRFHWHTFYECETQIDCDLQYFQTSESGEVGDFKPNNGKNIPQGHWYTQCVYKTSHICAVSDLAPIIPKLNWLTDKWQQNKIEKIKEALAAAKLLKPPIVAWIDAVKNHEENKRIEEELSARQVRLKLKLRPFVKNVKVECWRSQYREEKLRYIFLVLCGPSKMRKTEFAKSLFSNPFMHKDRIDWEGYKWKHHDCIVFDDVNLPDHIWRYVRQNKVLFQASSVVAVNTSATNCYKRDVCVVETPIIICTNEGLLEEKVSAQYQEWIKKNCVWIDVEEPFPLVSAKDDDRP